MSETPHASFKIPIFSNRARTFFTYHRQLCPVFGLIFFPHTITRNAGIGLIDNTDVAINANRKGVNAMQQNEVSIQERFERFHGENPQVYRAIHWSVMDLELQGHKHYSIDAILHVIRYDRNITTTGRNFKINNDFTSRYARKFMDEFPAYRGFFQLRELKS